DSAEQDAQHQAERDPGQSDRQRDTCRDHQPRPQIAPELIGAEEEDAVNPLSAFDAEKMQVSWDQPEQLIRIAVDEQRNRQLAGRIWRVDQLEGLRVAYALETAHMGPEGAVVEQRDCLRRDEAAAR